MLKYLWIVLVASGACGAEKVETVILDGKEVPRASLSNPVEYGKEPEKEEKTEKAACVT